MKQVVFAIALIAMASLTGCLNTEDDDDSSDATYKPSKDSTISMPYMEFTKTGNTITSNCKSVGSWKNYTIQISDTDSNIIWLLNGDRATGNYGWLDCSSNGWSTESDSFADEFKINITLPQEPVRIMVVYVNDDYHLRTYAGTF